MLHQIFKVSQYPGLLENEPNSFFDKLLNLLKTYGILFLALIAISPTILMVDYFVVHVLHYKTISGAQKHGMSQFLHKMGYWKALVYICLIGPLIEETVFRLPLSLKKKHIALGFAAAAFLFSSFFLKEIKSPLLNLSARLLLGGLVYVICFFTAPKGLSVIGHRFRKHLIVLSVLLFGLMHIGNYNPVQWPVIWIYPAYVLPQILMGWAITYVRFRDGFWWGFALHCMINSVSMALSFGHI
ncbi:MAG: CPBP family glutamic-type intramembrane protease [Mucilaginibacter sp.]